MMISSSFSFNFISRVGHFIGNFELFLDFLIWRVGHLITFQFEEFFVNQTHRHQQRYNADSNTYVNGNAPVFR